MNDTPALVMAQTFTVTFVIKGTTKEITVPVTGVNEAQAEQSVRKNYTVGSIVRVLRIGRAKLPSSLM